MRNHKITTRLNDSEFASLKSKVKRTGLSQEALIRMLIKNYTPKEKPDDRFYIVMRQLIGMSNNLQQICRKANALNFIDAPMLKKEFEKLDEFYSAIMARYLDPDRLDVTKINDKKLEDTSL